MGTFDYLNRKPWVLTTYEGGGGTVYLHTTPVQVVIPAPIKIKVEYKGD